MKMWKTISTFVLGAAVGVAATRTYFKQKYETIAQDEIESVKTVFGQRNDAQKKHAKGCEETAPVEKTDIEKEYFDISAKYNTASLEMLPYVIPPEDYGGVEGYEQGTLVYYADGVLADSNDDVISDISSLIGEEALGSFGQYEDDAVFVRNPALRLEFEILKDLRTFDEAQE